MPKRGETLSSYRRCRVFFIEFVTISGIHAQLPTFVCRKWGTCSYFRGVSLQKNRGLSKVQARFRMLQIQNKSVGSFDPGADPLVLRSVRPVWEIPLDTAECYSDGEADATLGTKLRNPQPFQHYLG